MEKAAPKRKILENPLLAGLVVPVLIVLVGSLIIVGVTKMLSSDQGYRQLVQEMHSKSFGNRWVAAYELSKLIASSKIPEEDHPWLLENLNELYAKAGESRTRHFLVAAAGALRSEKSTDLLVKGLSDSDSEVVFSSLTGLGNLPAGVNLKYTDLAPFLTHKDPLLRQTSAFVMSQHRILQAEPGIVALLNDPVSQVRYSAALALIPFKNSSAIEILGQLLLSRSAPEGLNEQSWMNLKMNIVTLQKKFSWSELHSVLDKAGPKEQNAQVQMKIQEYLNN